MRNETFAKAWIEKAERKKYTHTQSLVHSISFRENIIGPKDIESSHEIVRKPTNKKRIKLSFGKLCHQRHRTFWPFIAEAIALSGTLCVGLCRSLPLGSCVITSSAIVLRSFLFRQ